MELACVFSQVQPGLYKHLLYSLVGELPLSEGWFSIMLSVCTRLRSSHCYETAVFGVLAQSRSERLIKYIETGTLVGDEEVTKFSVTGKARQVWKCFLF